MGTGEQEIPYVRFGSKADIRLSAWGNLHLRSLPHQGSEVSLVSIGYSSGRVGLDPIGLIAATLSRNTVKNFLFYLNFAKLIYT